MIYIDPTNHGYFQSLSKMIKFEMDDEVEITTDYTKKGLWVLNYVSCMHSTAYDQVKENGCDYIVIQTEPIHEKKKFPKFIEFLNGSEKVIDYTDNFIIGYSDFWRIEYEESKLTDILFYGSINSKRQELIDRIGNVKILDNCFGNDLMREVMNSKIILSLMFYDKSNADWSRISPLLSNRAFVIAEKCQDDRFNALNDHIVIAERDEIPSLCEYYLNNPLERLEMAEKGYKYIKNERATTF